MRRLRAMVSTALSEHRRYGVLSSGRQDWGILRSSVLWLVEHGVDVRILLGGMACSDRHGRIDRLVEAEGLRVAERLAWSLDPSEGAEAPPHHEASRALAAVGDALIRQRIDALILVGDRSETLAAALAATVTRVPIVHLHGGEETEGAFDNAIRHAITKLSHLHLASHPSYAMRIVAMGEDPARVHVVGAPGLDNLRRTDLATRDELETFLGGPLGAPLVVTTVHPATHADDVTSDVEAVCAAMERVDATYVVTLPNNDPGNAAIRDRLLRAGAAGAHVKTTEALGERRYWGLLRIADAVLGNSSSGVIEAPALRVPVVNVGERQTGRLRYAGILDVAPRVDDVVSALRRALTPEFREFARLAEPPLGEGHAAEAIGRILMTWEPPNPPVKRFGNGRTPS